MLPVNRNPGPRDLRRFYTSVPAVLAICGCVFLLWKSQDPSPRCLRTIVGGLLCLLAIVLPIVGWRFPRLGRTLYVRWMLVGAALGAVVSTVVLTVLYFTLVAPFSLIRRRDPLGVRRGTAPSYWSDCTYSATLDRLRRRF